MTQHLAREVSVIGMRDFEHNDCMQSLYDLPGCIVCIGDSNTPFWFELLACQGSMHKEMVKQGLLYALYQKNSTCFVFF